MIYEIQSREENNVKILIKITKKENRIKQLQFSDGDIRYYIGEEQKTIYITVEENTSNETLETITLKIESSSGNSGTNTEEPKEEQKEEIKEEIKQESDKTTPADNTVVSSKLPQAGSNNTILFIIIALIALAILIRISLRKYNDIR